MTKLESSTHLLNEGCDNASSDSIRCDAPFISLESGYKEIMLDGHFTSEDLDAIVTLMRP